MRQFHSAGIILYHPHNGEISYLLLQYKHRHWDFVKGKLEAGETNRQAAVRELQEETGITSITLDPSFNDSFSYVYTEIDGVLTRKTVSFLIGSTPETKIVLSPEHIGYAWVSFEEALERLTFENARNVLRAAHAYIIGTSAK